MKRNTKEIRRFILGQIDDYGEANTGLVAKTFEISRQAAFKNVRELLATGVIEKTLIKEHPLRLKPLQDSYVSVQVGEASQENKVWSELVAPFIVGIKDNVREICHYGFTEMFNNVIDHSASSKATVWVKVDALVVRIVVQDFGIGIWKKLQEWFHLDDPRHALLELTKGKLTTDPKRHTGEGIFFTSRMFDKFHIASDKLSFCRFQEGEEWLSDIKEAESGPGTRVTMSIYLDAEKTARQIFDKFTAEFDDFGFTKTHLSVQLAKYEGDHLVSRSQAKRIVHNLDKFKEVYLDFRDVTDIGQAFSDEIFRVFQNDHRDIKIRAINANAKVQNMINRALSQDSVNSDQPK